MVLVDPTAVWLLALRQSLDEIGAPVMLDTSAVDDFVNSQYRKCLRHRVIVVEQTPLRPRLWHAGVLIDAIMLGNPLIGSFDARIIFGDTAINHALDAGIGHAAVAW